MNIKHFCNFKKKKAKFETQPINISKTTDLSNKI